MSFLSSVKKWIHVAIPALLFFVLCLLVLVLPGVERWGDYPAFHLLPFLCAAISGLLGWFFSQSRISFLSILVALVSYMIGQAVFIHLETDRAQALILFSAIYIPPMAALFYHMSERGVITVHGATRLAIIMSIFIMTEMLSRITLLHDLLAQGNVPFLFKPAANWCRIPWIGLFLLSICGPSLFLRNRRESPSMGPLILLAVLSVFAGLSFQSSLLGPARGYPALIIFMSAASVIMAWAVLESSWRSANIDELTDLPGRRALNLHQAKLGSNYVMAILDIDHFKKINDKFGHPTGDQVLRFISSTLKADPTGKAYRAGGEEFVIVVEKYDLREAAERLDQLRQTIKDRPFIIRSKDRPTKRPEGEVRHVSSTDRDTISVTVSIGVARACSKYGTPADVLAAADKALYRAKKDGRNKIKVAK